MDKTKSTQRASVTALRVRGEIKWQNTVSALPRKTRSVSPCPSSSFALFFVYLVAHQPRVQPTTALGTTQLWLTVQSADFNNKAGEIYISRAQPAERITYGDTNEIPRRRGQRNNECNVQRDFAMHSRLFSRGVVTIFSERYL